MTRLALEDLPFYRNRLDRRGRPAPWSVDDLEDFAAAEPGPFAGRVRSGAAVPVALQLEATSEPPVWIGLDGRELESWAAGLARIWTRLGIRAGDTIAFFDYGSNPAVLLASSIYVPHLKRGAIERLGATPVCNDGVASMTGRLLGILASVRPAALLVRRDLVAPLADALATQGLPSGGRLRAAIVSEVEGAPVEREVKRLHELLQVPVRRWLRADAATFAAADCARCGLFHVDRRLYRVASTKDGELVVSSRFARLCPAVGYRLGAGRLVGAGCEDEPEAERIAWG